MFDPLPPGALLEVTAEISDWADPDDVEYGCRVSSSLAVWRIENGEASPAHEWHHQITLKGKIYAYARTRDLDGSQDVCEWAISPVTTILEEAIKAFQALMIERVGKFEDIVQPYRLRVVEANHGYTKYLWISGPDADTVICLWDTHQKPGHVFATLAEAIVDASLPRPWGLRA